MNVLILSVIILLLLLLIKEVFSPLHHLIYIIFYFLILSIVLSSFLIPFADKLLQLLPYIPFGKPLIYSAVLFMISEHISNLLEELDYESLGMLVSLAIRIVILTYWLNELGGVLKELEPFIKWLQ